MRGATRQYPRLVGEWAASVGLDARKFGAALIEAHKAVLIYRLSANWEPPRGATIAGHRRIESTVRYLGIEIDDAIEIAEKIDI